VLRHYLKHTSDPVLAPKCCEYTEKGERVELNTYVSGMPVNCRKPRVSIAGVWNQLCVEGNLKKPQ